MLERKLSRREFLRATSVAAVGGMLAACVPATPAPAPEKPAAAPTPAPAKPLTVKFWTFWGGFEEMHDAWNVGLE